MLGSIRVGNKRAISDFKPEVGEVMIHVDRPSILGNPYAVNSRRTREQAIEEYRAFLEHQMKRRKGPVYDEICRIAEYVLNGQDVILMCWCAPLPCHAGVVKETVEQLVKP
jgi:hypothetical protein